MATGGSARVATGKRRGDADADSFKIGGHTALLFRLCVTEESIQIQGPCIHRDRTIGIVRPFLFRTIPVKLQPVLIGIAEVKRFTHPVITRAFEWNLGCEQPAKCRVAEPRSIGIKNSNVKQTGAAGRRWRTAETFPRVQSDVMERSAAEINAASLPQRCISSNPSTPQ